MKRGRKALLRGSLEALLTVMTLVLAAMLMVQCIHIYAVGNAPENLTEAGVKIQPVYSRDTVAQHLKPLAIPLLGWVLLLVLCALGGMRRPRKPNMPSLEPEVKLLLQSRRHEDTDATRAEQRRRRLARAICAVICVLCAAAAGAYLLNREHFTSWDLEMVMGQMLLHVAPWVLIAFAALLALSAWERRSVLRELELVKNAPIVPVRQEMEKHRPLGVWRTVLYAAAVALLVAGILNGGMYDVLVKAINICTECIGLG